MTALLTALLTALFGMGALPAQAEAARWHIGVGAEMERQAFNYGKTVYTEAGLAQGVVTSADSDAEGTLATVAAFAGRRWPLPGERGLALVAEVDVAWHPTRLEGYLQGTGHTWTDTWPEDWWLQRDHSYGLTLKLAGLRKRPGLDVYALAGWRRTAAEFSITETGCPGPELQCPPTPLASFTDAVDRRLAAWSLGAGVERRLSARHALQVEVRWRDYRRNRWNRLFEGGVVIPSTVDGSELGLAVRLVRKLR